MITCEEFHGALAREGVGYFSGVPDSLLKEICAYINDHTDPANHVIAANEGAAVALASGYHLATGGLGLVYLQNSGLGNTINPLASLADPEVYSIPMLLLIGWRGEPGVADEPQHRKQGRITLETLSALDLPHAVLPQEPEAAKQALALAVDTAKKNKSPYALVVRKDTFAKYAPQKLSANVHEMTREQAIITVLETLAPTDRVIATTGMTSREVFEYRERAGQARGLDFLTVGCMGHASQIALGVARARTGNRIYCLDGDGACIMHLGGLAVIGAQQPANYRHVVINNGAHDSVGGQPTVGFQIDIPAIAVACGYRSARRVSSLAELKAVLPEFNRDDGPALLEILVRRGARADLGRPTRSPIENKADFMAGLNVVLPG